MGSDSFKRVRNFASDIKKLERFVHGWYGCQRVSDHFFQMWLGRLNFHVFYNPDPADVLHDHAWPFWTFPLKSYVEDVLVDGKVVQNTVKSWRWHYRPSSYSHRMRRAVSGKYVPTIVWKGKLDNPGYNFMEINNDGTASPLTWKQFMKKQSNGRKKCLKHTET